MRNKCLVIFSLSFIGFLYCQNDNLNVIDTKYKEDQFYTGITYNSLYNEPSGFLERSFSLGFNFGVIKDIPFNTSRNFGMGIGLGYALNSYSSNLRIFRDTSNNISYDILEIGTFSKNRFTTHLIEMPIQIRWRTSTSETYDFWRVYTGVRLGYVFSKKALYEGDLGRSNLRKNEHLNNFQYGLSLSAGYSTWNIYAYYALHPIFSNEAKFEESPIDLRFIRIGLIFYIL